MLRYRRTLRYLLATKGIRAAYNFIFVKLFVEHGEGGLGFVFWVLIPLFKFFPGLASRLVPYPRNVEIEITTKCDKRCILCEHTYWDRKEKNKDLTLEDFKRIADQFPSLKWVNLTGEGDAFLNKDYLDMIRYLKAQDVPVYLVDSLDLVDPDLSKELIEIGVDGIWISFDAATKETYERIKVGCSFERSLSHIKSMIDLKKKMGSPIPELCFRYVVTTLNVHEMPLFIDLVRSLEDRDTLGDGSRVEFVGLLGFKEIEEFYVPDVPDAILQAVIEKAKGADFELAFTHTSGTNKPPLRYCRAWYEPYIMIGGYVMPCCAVLMSNDRDFLRQHSLGNVLERPFREIWYSNRYRRFRDMIPRDDAPVPILCRGCRVYDTTERQERYGCQA